MRFVIVKPKTREVIAMNCDQMRDAEIAAGLDPDHVDHGTLMPRLGYVVHEFGMFVPAAEQSYFGLCGCLIAGAAVLYGFDEAGETIPLLRSAIPDVRFYLGVNDIEASIARDEIHRPFVAVNGELLWEWPNPPPKGMMP